MRTLSATIEQPQLPEAPAPPAGASPSRMPHLPGLDGLRGLAVIGVLLFHGGFTWAKGGFLGVSTFFTLSGFLITNLLVREWDASSTIRLGRFWVRRFRRLLPAALVTIALVGLLWWRIGSPEQLADLRADMLAALGYAANWRFLTAGTSYADLFSAPSPLQHFWSLAIEEQFYLLFPLVVIGLMRLGGRRALTAALALATAASLALGVWLGTDIDRVYYGTDTRAAELLLGALLAVWWSGRSRGRRPRHAPAEGDAGRWMAVGGDALGLVALVAMFWAWHAVEQTSEDLARGGFPLYAVGTTAIIYAATLPGVTTRLLSWAPLRWAGLVSYGLYLYHWPVFLYLDADRTGLDTLPLFVVRMAVTTAIAVVSYFFLEMPIRRGAMIKTGRSLLSAGVAGAVAVAGCAVVVTLDPPASTIPYADVEVGEIETVVVESSSPPTSSTLPTPTTVDVPATVARRVFIVGDSGTVDATPALTSVFQAAGAEAVIQGAGPGFGLTRPLGWREDWAATIAQQRPDLVVVMLGAWDLRFVDQNGPDAYLPVVREAVDILSAGGARILWLPVMPGGRYDAGEVNEVFAQLPALYPGVVASPDTDFDLSGPDGGYPTVYVTEAGTEVLLRKPDGWHLCQEGAERVATVVNQEAEAVGWALLPQAPWEDGMWRGASAYDDPPGACATS